MPVAPKHENVYAETYAAYHYRIRAMTPSRFVSLAAEFRAMMIEHALREAPNECCGLLLGKNGRFTRFAAMKSDPPAPDAYWMDPVQQIKVFSAMKQRDEELVGIYHSHPKGPAGPSGADLQLAFHPEAVYFIISLAGAGQPELKAFMLRSNAFEEVPISLKA